MPGDLELSLGPTQTEFVDSAAHIVQIIGPMGEGKCLKKGTKILMYDGALKNVEDIRAGDRVMGDDGTPRNVLNLGHGYGQLYRVVPIKGEPFATNGEHILCLKRTPTKKPDRLAGTVIHISVNDYLKTSQNFRNIHKLYRSAVDFPSRVTLLGPYFLGIWLGDGHSHLPAITTPDKEIIQFLQRYSKEIGVGLKKRPLKDNQADTYAFSDGNQGGITNPLTEDLRRYNLIKNKHIPIDFKANSRSFRLSLLAGLADSDGYVNRNSYQFIFKSKTLARDVLFLCRSLGFAAYMKKVRKKIKVIDFEGEYYQVGVSGDLSVVPALIPRKRCPKRKPFKDVLTTGIREIVHIGEGEYFGFVLDGNHRFLLGDFTVTHNTYAGAVGLAAHAQRCECDIRSALIRDTFQNIKTSTLPDLQEYFADGWMTLRDGGKQIVINSKPKVSLDLFGIDDERAISKLQGPQYALVWLEEPAPIYEKTNAGLPIGVFRMALARAARQRDTVPRVQISQNPSDDEHWTAELADEPHDYLTMQDPGTGEWVTITKDTFWIPRGENKYLSPIARAANMAAFKGDEAKYQRYVLGETATVSEGRPVIPGYSPQVHFSKKILPVFKGQLIAMWDSWTNASCILAQYTPQGQLVIHDVLHEPGKGPEEIMEEHLDILLNTPKYKNKATSWRIIGDRTMLNPNQSTSRRSTATIIGKKYDARFEGGPAHWHSMTQSISRCFKSLLNGGIPSIILSRSATKLNRSLRGGWHYKVDVNGNITGSLPVKNIHSHVGDAFANGICVLMPYKEQKTSDYKKLVEAQRKRARSYGGGNYSRRPAAGMNITTGFGVPG